MGGRLNLDTFSVQGGYLLSSLGESECVAIIFMYVYSLDNSVNNPYFQILILYSGDGNVPENKVETLYSGNKVSIGFLSTHRFG